MTPTDSSTTPSFTPAQRWTGRVLRALVVLFLLLDGWMKVARAQPAIEGTVQLGYPESSVFTLGVLVLLGTLLYVIPRTSLLGAIVLTGYLGGAVAAHVRVGNPLFSHTLFPVYLGVMLWAGLVLREARLRALLFERPPAAR